MKHIVSKRFKDGMSRDLKKVYKDICKTYGLAVHMDCESYINEIWRSANNGGIAELYQDISLTILYFYLIRYIKSVRPRFYRDNRGLIMHHNFEKDYIKNYIDICYLLPRDITDEWVKLLKEAKF